MSIQFKNFDRMFHPKRVAVIGVSSEGFGFGTGILLALKSIGFDGELCPVNPNGGTVAGMQLYRSVAEIPGDIDFGIIAVPAPKVPEALEACRKKGAAGAEILSSGFRELGTSDGIALEARLTEIADSGIRVLGPNCFGIYCPKSGLTMLPGPDLSREPGPVALLSQSGGLSIDFAYQAKWRGIQFSKMISFGNGCDLRETEMLEYLHHDPETRIICMYVEGIKDGRAFLRVLREVALEKPVIVMKGGLSEAGSRAVASHTASMGGSRDIWDAALRQSNVVQARNLQEMSDAALAFSMLPIREYRGLTVVGGGGALGVNTADTAEKSGLSVPALDIRVQEKIGPILPRPGSSPANPIDIANPYVAPEVLEQTLIHASSDDSIDLHIMIQLLHTYKALAVTLGKKSVKDLAPVEKLVDACGNALKSGGKPVVMVLPNYKQELESMDVESVIREAREGLVSKGIPVFERVDDALKAVSMVSRYAVRRRLMQQKMD